MHAREETIIWYQKFKKNVLLYIKYHTIEWDCNTVLQELFYIVMNNIIDWKNNIS